MNHQHLILLRSTIFISCLMVVTQSLFSQTPAEQRKQFFLGALLNPDSIESQIRDYAQYKGKRKYSTLYKIYESCKLELGHRETMMKFVEDQLAEYPEDYKTTMRASLTEVYVRPPAPIMQGRLGYFVQSYLMSLRADIDDELLPEQVGKVDLLISQLDKILLLSYQSQYMATYDYYEIKQEPADDDLFEIVYRSFLTGIMNITYARSNYSNRNAELTTLDHDLVKIIRYGELIENKHLPTYGRYDAYMALIQRKGIKEPLYVPLSTDVLSNAVYYKQYISQYADPYSNSSIENDSSYFRYWQPIQEHLKDLREIYFQPAGIYHGIALEALRLSSGGYVSDHINIVRVYDREHNQASSYGRPNQKKQGQLAFEIFGYPDYDYDIRIHQPIVDRKIRQKSPKPLDKSERMLYEWVKANAKEYPVIAYDIPDQGVKSIRSLAMSKIESRVLHQILTQHEMKGRLYLDSLSNQFNLEQIESPRALHLTTHTTYGGKSSPLPIIQDTINGGFKNNATRIFLSGGRESMNTREFYDQYYADIGEVIGQQQNDIMTRYYSQVDTTQTASAFNLRKLLRQQKEQAELLMRMLDSAGAAGLSQEQEARLNVAEDRVKSFPQFDGVMMEEEIMALKLENTEIVTLSSCGPQGAERSPRALLSLANSFLSAGAESVLGSMWPVNDEASALFMLKFYNYWASGKNKSEAVKLAKYDVRKIPDFEHPHFWAGWMLYGKQQ